MCIRQRRYGFLERNQVLVTEATMTFNLTMPPAASTTRICFCAYRDCDPDIQ
jgi:hypothetical protein